MTKMKMKLMNLLMKKMKKMLMMLMMLKKMKMKMKYLNWNSIEALASAWSTTKACAARAR